MTRNDTSYRTKGRAVFLAAIMVLSMVAMSVAFAGGAAAVEPKEVNNLEDEDPVYPGQEFNTSISDSESWDEDDTAFLVELERDEGNVDGFASTIRSVDQETWDGDNGYYEVDTADIESGNDYALSNTSSYRGDATNVTQEFTALEEGFAVEFDDDTVDEEDDESELELDSDRSTGNYNVTLNVDGPDDFDADEINSTFNITNNPGYEVTDSDHLPLDELGYDRDEDDDVTDLRDDGYVTLNVSNMTDVDEDIDGDDLKLNFEQLDEDEGLPDNGDYEFEFLVTDTGATATDSIEIQETDVDADFSEGTYDTASGDIAEFEFELEDTDEAWVQIGDEDSDFLDVIAVEADDEDEPVEIAVNTRLLGTDTSLDGEDEVYDVENVDDFESGYHDIGEGDFSITPDQGDLFGDDGSDLSDSYADYVANLSLVDDPDEFDEQLTRPLQPTDYELQIAGDDIDEDDDESVFDADAGAGEATDQLDSAVLELQEVDIGDITTHTAPEDDADDVDEDVEELVDAATAREEIAIEDRLVVQIEATGLYGALVAGPEDESDEADDPDFDRLEEGFGSEVLYNVTTVDDQINLDIEAEARSGNQDPLEIDLEEQDDSDTFVLVDHDEGQFFVVADTSSDSAFANGDAPEDDVSFTAEFEYDADNEDDRWEFDDDASPAPFDADSDAENYPYLQQGEVLSSSAEFDFEPREIDFDNLNADDEVQAENVNDSEISAETNVAPGSDAELRASSTDASTSFRIGEDVEINEDGELSAEYDFSGQEAGDEFDTRFRASGSTVDTVDSVIVEEGDLGVEDPVEDDEDDDVVDDDDDVVDDDDDVVDDDDDVVDDDDDEVEDVDDETPGFGAIVALVALIGAALLAVRRQN